MTKTFSEQLPINLITNILVFLLSVIINLFMTPFYIDTVGIEGLGLLRLALTIPMYTSLVTIFISGAVSRYLVIALQQHDVTHARSIFSTSFVSLAVLIVVLFPVILLIFFNVDTFLNVPIHFRNEVSLLFIAIFAASMVSLLSSLFMIPAQAYNRLEIANAVQIVTTVVQTALIVLLLSYFPHSISLVGIAFVAGALISLLLAIKVWRKLAPELQVRLAFFQKHTFKEISGTGSWLIVNHLGTLLFLYVDLLVVNIFFGADSTGEYSVGLQWSMLLRSMAAVFASVLTPILLISYAQENFSKLVTVSRMGVKFMGLILALPIGLLAGFAEPLLLLWLGEEYTVLAPLLWLMLGHLAINLAVTPLFALNTAYNKVKFPAIVSVLMGILNLALAIAISVIFDFGIYGVALAGAIVLTLKNTLFIPIYSAKIMGTDTFTFLKEMLPGSLFTLGIFTVAWYIGVSISITSWLGLFSIMIMISIVTIVPMWLFGLNDKERSFIAERVKRKITKSKNSTESKV